MRLFEYEAKELLTNCGIVTPKGGIGTNSDQIMKIAHRLKSPFVLKAQVLVSGRGKAGGIQFVSSLADVKKAAESLFQKQIRGVSVRKILVEEKIKVNRELYFAVTLDRIKRSYVAIASSKGGVNIEIAASEQPTSISKTLIDPVRLMSFSDAQEIAGKMGYKGKKQAMLAVILKNLCQIGIDQDAVLMEVNPLAETLEGTFVVLDSRLIIDDNALLRHPEFYKLSFEEDREHTQDEIVAIKEDLSYVRLEGNVGIIGNGAGLVMATLDTVKYFGGKPANFLDLGGGAPTDRIETAIKIVCSNPRVRVLLINILGGLTKCDDVAKAILKAKRESEITSSVIVRLFGTNHEEGKRILSKAGLVALESMDEAAKQAVETASREKSKNGDSN